MTNERHEKALEEAAHAFYGEYGRPPAPGSKGDMANAIKAYLASMDAVIVPKVASEEMEIAARSRVKPFHDISDKEWRSQMPADLFRLAWTAMLSKAPNHFTNGE